MPCRGLFLNLPILANFVDPTDLSPNCGFACLLSYIVFLRPLDSLECCSYSFRAIIHILLNNVPDGWTDDRQMHDIASPWAPYSDVDKRKNEL